MSKARDNANNWAADITAVSAGVGVTGGGTSGAVTVTNDMATTIDAKGDLVVGTGADTYTRVPVGSNNQVLTADSATTSGVKWATADALPSQTGNSGKYLTTNGTTASWGTVNQPITWTYRYNEPSGNDWTKIEYNGSNLFVAVGGAGKMATSSDGITWTARTSGFGTNTIRAIAFGNGLWVAVGDNGTITTSTDGITWTARTANMGTNRIWNVTYANSLWVAVGDGGGTTNTGGITYSSDGITWTRKSQSITGAGNGYRCVVWNGTNWIVGTELNTTNYLYASTPSGTWTAGISGSSDGIFYLFWDGTRHIEIPQGGGNAYTSTSTTLGNTTQVFGNTFSSSPNFANYFYNNKIYTTGAAIIESGTSISSNYLTSVRYIGNGILLNNATGGLNPISGNKPILACSLGYIICGSYGSIWTSF